MSTLDDIGLLLMQNRNAQICQFGALSMSIFLLLDSAYLYMFLSANETGFQTSNASMIVLFGYFENL